MNLFTTERNNCRRRLILLVKKHPMLWNKEQGDYKRNRPRKMQTWQAIANEMGSTSDKIRRTWENLRDQYRRDLKREVKYGFVSKWRFFQDMDFIRHMVTSKETKTDSTDSDSENECSDFSQYLNQSLEPPHTSQFAQPPSNADQPSTSAQQATISSNVNEFQPIMLSKQWQKPEEVRGTKEELPNKTISFKPSATFQLPQNNATSSCTSNFEECTQSWNCLEGDQANFQAPKQTLPPSDSLPLKKPQQGLSGDIIDLEFTPKVEPSDNIEIGPTAFTVIPALPTESTIQAAQENFQESHVTTSSPKCFPEVLEEFALKPGRKRKSAESHLEDSSKDEDFHFAMSLVPSMRKIPRHRKLALRIVIMNAIAKDLEEVCKCQECKGGRK